MTQIKRRIGYYEYKGRKFEKLNGAFWYKLLDDRGVLNDGFKDFY